MQDVQSRNLIEGMLLLENFFVRTLFDTEATHSFVANELAKQLNMRIYLAPFHLKLVSPMEIREIIVEYVKTNVLYVGRGCYSA